MEFDLVVIVCTFFNWRTKQHRRVSTEGFRVGSGSEASRGAEDRRHGFGEDRGRGQRDRLEGFFMCPTHAKFMNREDQTHLNFSQGTVNDHMEPRHQFLMEGF